MRTLSAVMLQAAVDELDSFGLVVVDMITDACQDTIDSVEANMNETLGRTSKLIRALSRNMSTRRDSKRYCFLPVHLQHHMLLFPSCAFATSHVMFGLHLLCVMFINNLGVAHSQPDFLPGQGQHTIHEKQILKNSQA